MNWKKSAICYVSFLAVFFGEIAINLACGPEQDPYDYYISYFHNNVQGDEYAPFAFNALVPLYSDEEPASETDINSAEWASYLKVKKEDVYNEMYGAADSLGNNSFWQALAKNAKAKAYYTFAKSCEPFTVAEADVWDPAVRDSVLMIKKAKEALTLADKMGRDDFLKLRYAYQAERLFHYAKNYAESKLAYEKLISPIKTNSAAKGWATAVYAGAVRYAGQPTEAAFLYSKVFASNPERRVQAYKNYFYTSSSVNNVLSYAKTDQEKADVLAIASFGNPEFQLERLQQVYRYKPSSLLNGALLVREVSKLEKDLIERSKYSKDFLDRYWDNDKQSTDSLKRVHLNYLARVKAFALKLATEKKYPEPELGTVTAAYLSWMEDKPLQAQLYLQEIKSTAQLSVRLRDQIRIVMLLCEASKIKKGSTFNESSLLPVLKWLDEKRYAENTEQKQEGYSYIWSGGQQRFTTTTRNFYQQLLAPAYIKMGDTARAALAMLKGDLFRKPEKNTKFSSLSWQTMSFWRDYLGPKSIEALASIRKIPPANNLDGLLAYGFLQLNNDDFYELCGTVYLRTHQYAKALAWFNKLDKNYALFEPSNWYSDQILYANPFNTTFNDYPKQYVSKTKRYNKKSFAQEMLRLQQLIVSDKKNAALYYFKMANGVYQTGYYGNAWFLISYDWSSYNNYDPAAYAYDADFKLAKTAKAWYLKARALSTDPDFKAKCTFMLAKCEQKRIVNTSFINWYDNDYEAKQRGFIAKNINNPYFRELKASYAQTPFYKTAVGECSYLRDFLRSTAVKK
ncbi:hypothetical protein VRU48_17505 [Pedobacter sp. KR3-3]|uniref:Tetratricopeptide repeat protein n=1 Tax=Pedobacter albus TaxID=3113905 RepID=A0ABU7IC30_9SPHI|nr:hypothetical protein [Pedobacter sp. KR3-3]MEE1946927.1 hypothetical protein [Pedobacter sp. KR3-3]